MHENEEEVGLFLVARLGDFTRADNFLDAVRAQKIFQPFELSFLARNFDSQRITA